VPKVSDYLRMGRANDGARHLTATLTVLQSLSNSKPTPHRVNEGQVAQFHINVASILSLRVRPKVSIELCDEEMDWLDAIYAAGGEVVMTASRSIIRIYFGCACSANSD